jgi:hypothetical protein
LTPNSARFHESPLIFRADLAYLSFREDTLIQKGSYSFKKKGRNTIISYNIEKEYLPEGKNVFIPDKYVEFKTNDTLILRDVCYDCYISEYNRIQ